MNNNPNIYVDIHCLQTVPSSNINRDDTGSPKTCIFGGTTRSRVSSQAWKRAIRLNFQDRLPLEEQGVRTKKIVGMVADEIRKIDPSITEEKAEKDASDALTNAGLKIKNAKDGTDALLLMSYAQAKALAELAAAGEKDKKAYKNALASNPSIDMALFGRMVAADPSLNYDAAVQVAHAMSTHAIDVEYDYFTAVDDMAAEDTAGAGHIGVREYDSSTLYRYATVNVRELYRSVGLQAPEVTALFAEEFVKSMPSGMMNSYANRTVPCAVYIAVREDQPVSFAGAFEKAIPASDEGYEARSKKNLVNYAEKVYTDFVDQPYASYTVGDGLEELAESKPFKEVLAELETVLKTLLSAGE